MNKVRNVKADIVAATMKKMKSHMSYFLTTGSVLFRIET